MISKHGLIALPPDSRESETLSLLSILTSDNTQLRSLLLVGGVICGITNSYWIPEDGIWLDHNRPTVLIFNKIEQAEHKQVTQEKYAPISKAKGKRRPITVVIPKFNHPRFSSEQVFFRNLRSILVDIESIRIFGMVSNQSYVARWLTEESICQQNEFPQMK